MDSIRTASEIVRGSARFRRRLGPSALHPGLTATCGLALPPGLLLRNFAPMLSRAVFILVAIFWVTMNVLLWRAEFGGGRGTVSDIPVETVIDRALNAPDTSVMALFHRRERLGQARLSPAVVEAAMAEPSGDLAPEGMVRALGGYRVDLEVNLSGELPSSRWRMLGRLDLNTNRVWQSFELRLIQRPVTWAIAARAGDDKFRLRYEEGKTVSEQSFAAGDLPQLAAMVSPLAPWFSAVGFPNNPAKGAESKSLSVWSARNDWLKVGKSRVRAYRLKGRFLNRFDVVAYLSRAGELLKVTLPDGYSLVNEALPISGGD